MKILMLTHRFPWPPNRGTTIRSYHLLKYLASQHEVLLLSFVDTMEGLPERLRHLQKFCKKIETVLLNDTIAKIKAAQALLNGKPLSVEAFYSKKFENSFKEIIQVLKPDLVVTDSSALAFYPFQHAQPFIADFMDVDSEKWNQFSTFSRWPLNWIYRMESKQLAEFERKVASQSEAILVVSENERRQLQKLAPQTSVCVIPNGVDPSYFYPSNTSLVPGRIVFTGVMDYFPNIEGVCWFCREIGPKVKEEVPEASFFIVGINPSSKVRALRHLSGVYVTGTVPDVRLFLGEAQVCVAPLRFAIGLQNKVLEALAMGKAVVATPGAVQGLASEPQAVIKVANTAGEFAENVVEFLKREDIRQKYEKTGPFFIKKYHDWNRNLKEIENLYQVKRP